MLRPRGGEPQRARWFSSPRSKDRHAQNPGANPRYPTVALLLPPHSTRHPWKCREGSVGGRTPVEKYLLVVQQQHDGVELLAGAVVGPQRDDEVVEAVPSCLCRNDDQFVLEPVGFGVLKAVVFAALCVGQSRDSVHTSWRIQPQAAPAAPPHLVQPQAAERGFLRQKVAQGRGAPDVGRVWGVALHIPAAERNLCEDTGRAFHLSNPQTGKTFNCNTGKRPAKLSCRGWEFPAYTYLGVFFAMKRAMRL